MPRLRRPLLALLFWAVCWPSPVAHSEVLVRWDQDQVPPRDMLGIGTLLIPAANAAAVRDAIAKGYSVYLEVEAGALPAPSLPAQPVGGVVVTGGASAEQVRQVEQRLGASGVRVRATEEGGSWPHVRLNWVTLRNDVLQVSSRTAQPWIETNATLVRVAQVSGQGDRAPLLAYAWEPITVSDAHAGPGLDNYLVAIAEAGSFGFDLVLPLHQGFQRALLLGKPVARAEWQQIRRHVEFYGLDLPRRYRQVSNVAVVTADPAESYSALKLMTRHNLPYEVVAPGALQEPGIDSYRLVIALDPLAEDQLRHLGAFAAKGGTVVLAGGRSGHAWEGAELLEENEEQVGYRVGAGRVLELAEPASDPDKFAQDMRHVLAPEHRVLDIWNGVTVITGLYREPEGDTVLLTAVNYAHEAQPIQVRVQGTFSQVHFETPESDAVLLPFRHRHGQTEFVLPALRIGGRVFLSGNDAGRRPLESRSMITGS
jgi:hypothetical protein